MKILGLFFLLCGSVNCMEKQDPKDGIDRVIERMAMPKHGTAVIILENDLKRVISIEGAAVLTITQNMIELKKESECVIL